MSVKRNDEHSVTGEHRHVGDDREVVGVDIQLVLWFKIEAVLIEKTSILCI